MAKEYIVQKAVEASKVIKKRQRSLEYMEANYEAQHKYDGCCAVMFFPPEGGVYTQSRTGEENFALAQIEHLLCKDYEYTGTVLIGEAWEADVPFNEISGRFRRYAEDDRLCFVVNNVITWDEFQAGHSDVPYRLRKRRFKGDREPRVWFALSYAPGTIDVQAKCNELVSAGGYDGLVLWDLDGTWTIGSGTTGEIIKLKQKLSFDLRVLEVNTVKGAKTGRDVYKLVVDFRGLRLGVGSGVPHSLCDVPVVGDIVEIEAMDYSSDGLLREPRYKGIRHDKLEPDA